MVQKDPIAEIQELREQGLTDSLIGEELTRRGYSPRQVQMALSQSSFQSMEEAAPTQPLPPPSYSTPSYSQPAREMPADSDQGNFYERIEEMAENLIDEKWDDLIAEVKKIVEWKEKIEERQRKIQGDLDKLKENFTILHQGVLGKLEDYDTRMRDVGTELKAVGKVFKDVVPEFVENVKELKSLTERVKK